jgi:fibronectin type 3 domain-containing protein
VRLYRRAGTTGEPALLVPDPLAGTSFEDTGAAQGQTFCYVARLVTSADPLVESANSAEACVDVKDVFPPAVPTGLAALLQDAEVEVSWSPSTDADLKAYRVYRASGDAAPQRVAEVAAGKTSVRDAPPAGTLFVYTLTAVDQSGNESAPSAPAEVRREAGH